MRNLEIYSKVINLEDRYR